MAVMENIELTIGGMYCKKCKHVHTNWTHIPHVDTYQCGFCKTVYCVEELEFNYISEPTTPKETVREPDHLKPYKMQEDAKLVGRCPCCQMPMLGHYWDDSLAPYKHCLCNPMAVIDGNKKLMEMKAR